jgi:hypothetical protein
MATDEQLKAWVPEAEWDSLLCEKSFEPSKTDAELARETLYKGAPMAARSIAHLSVHGRDEKIRFTAAKYIIDGVIGGGFNAGENLDDVLVELVRKLGDNDSAADQMRQKLS